MLTEQLFCRQQQQQLSGQHHYQVPAPSSNGTVGGLIAMNSETVRGTDSVVVDYRRQVPQEGRLVLEVEERRVPELTVTMGALTPPSPVITPPRSPEEQERKM